MNPSQQKRIASRCNTAAHRSIWSGDVETVTVTSAEEQAYAVTVLYEFGAELEVDSVKLNGSALVIAKKPGTAIGSWAVKVMRVYGG